MRILHKLVFRGSVFPWHLSIPVDECGQAGNKTNAQHSKRRAEDEGGKQKVPIIRADAPALIEKICPHANVTAAGRKSGLARRTREHAESRKIGREQEKYIPLCVGGRGRC